MVRPVFASTSGALEWTIAFQWATKVYDFTDLDGSKPDAWRYICEWVNLLMRPDIGNVRVTKLRILWQASDCN
ncbi:hypothetical protein [Nostoc sp.]|uniref:hypothetical protein n=1 Tax=Nostoc sp. TaxID=1180 RepID=UPI002FF859C6